MRSDQAGTQTRLKPAPFGGLPMHSCVLVFVANKAWIAPKPQRGCRGVFLNLFSAPPHAVLPPPAPRKTPPNCAPALIAPKPGKPCDRAVFGALNLLPKKEQKALHQPPGCRARRHSSTPAHRHWPAYKSAPAACHSGSRAAMRGAAACCTSSATPQASASQVCA